MTITAGPVPAQYTSCSRPSCAKDVRVKPGTASVIAYSSPQPLPEPALHARTKPPSRQDSANPGRPSMIAVPCPRGTPGIPLFHDRESVVHRLEVTETVAGSDAPAGRIAA